MAWFVYIQIFEHWTETDNFYQTKLSLSDDFCMKSWQKLHLADRTHLVTGKVPYLNEKNVWQIMPECFTPQVLVIHLWGRAWECCAVIALIGCREQGDVWVERELITNENWQLNENWMGLNEPSIFGCVRRYFYFQWCFLQCFTHSRGSPAIKIIIIINLLFFH